MKIAMIGQKGMPALAGGVEKHVQELSTRLAANGDEVVVYTRSWYTPAIKTEHDGVRLVSLPSLHSKNLDAISHTALAIMHAAFIERPDVIHIHAVGPALLTGLARVLAPRSKIVVTFHCIDRQHQKWSRFAKIMLWLGEWIAMKFAHEVISVSRTLKNYAYEAYGRDTTYIPNGISQVQARQASMITQEFGLHTDDYFVCVARLVRHKGIHFLIRAYQQLRTTKKLVIVGDGAFTDDYVNEIKALAAGNPNIIFTGLQTGQMLEELFSNAYAFILPSQSEGLPIALLEAASYGKAVLASDIPANLEIVQHCGLSFTNGSISELADKLQLLINEPDLVETTGRAARKYVLRHYLWDDVAAHTTMLYKRVLAHQPSQTKLAHVTTLNM